MSIYYSPDDLGLVSIGSLSIRIIDWEFHLFGVWYSPVTKYYYTGTDSGCSCPTPFESFGALTDFDRHETAHSVVTAIRALGETDEDPSDLIARVMRGVS